MLAAVGLIAALAAGAHPPPAVAASPCAGSPPPVGAAFHGPVLHVIDGRTLCVAQGRDPASWIAVQLDGVPAATPWGALMAAAFTQTVDCRVATADASGAVIGRCTIQGRPLGDVIGDAAVQDTASAWRRHALPQDSSAPARFAAVLP